MKKFVCTLITVAMVFSLAACGSSGSSTESSSGTDSGAEESSEDLSEETEEIQIALLLYADGSVDDKSFGSTSWAGITQFCEENEGFTGTYYVCNDDTVEEQLSTADVAVKGGADFLICATDTFKVGALEISQAYPDIPLLVIDTEPQTTDGDVIVEDNVLAVTFTSEQSGFLAGYAAVAEGFTSIGFMGGQAVPGVRQYGYGFLAGIDYAAEELGINNIEVKYNYAGTFLATPENQSRAAAWYQSGTEVIFGCGGSLGNSVFAAAEQNEGKAIGVDNDQYYESDTVITSALKDVTSVVVNTLTLWVNGEFPGGESQRQDITDGACGLAMDNARFDNFTLEDYEELCEKLINNEDGITDAVPDYLDYEEPTELVLENITLDYIQ